MMEKVYCYACAYILIFFDKLVYLIDNSNWFAGAVWAVAIVMFLKMAGVL